MSQYICSLCKGSFETGRPEEEANKEALDNFGVENASRNPTMVVVCDDCYRKMTNIIPPKTWKPPKEQP